MNYRHIYHAGNFADCLKHIILSRILIYMQKKEKPFFVLDTHAGIGRYDLEAEEAQKTEEWQHGIGRLIGDEAEALPADCLDLCTPYFDVIKELNPDGPITRYPGSPHIIQALTRQQDRATFIEMHPADSETLKQNCGRDRRCHIKQADGWTGLRADLPPKERRGLVLVDPPFEEPDEYTRMILNFFEGYKRWATGTYCLWYPIKARRDVDAMAEMINEAGIDNSLRAELIIHKLDTAKRLNGTGLFIINPPYKLRDELQILLPFLANRFGQDARRHKIEWIRPPL